VAGTAPLVRRWQIGLAAGAAALAAVSLWANWPGLRADYWRSRLERSGEPRAAEELLAMGRAGEDALVEVLRGGGGRGGGGGADDADDAEARISAACALSGARPRPAVIRALRAAADDPSAEVRRSAAGALSALVPEEAGAGASVGASDGEAGGDSQDSNESGRDG